MIEGLPQRLRFASKNEPDKNQIIEKLRGIAATHDLKKDIEFLEYHKDKGLKVYSYKIVQTKCTILVERLEMMEF